jgi:tetratricopeptide (TPR) repeat protein
LKRNTDSLKRGKMWKPLRRFQDAMLRRIGVCLLLAAAGSGALWCASKPLNRGQIEGLLRGGVASQRIARIVATRGIDFKPTPAFLRLLKSDGAQPSLLDSLRDAHPRLPREARQHALAPPGPSLSPEAMHYAEQYVSAQQHFEQGKQFFQQQRWPDTEVEMQQAVDLDPMNIEAHFDLGYALSQQGKLPEAVSEYRRVLQLDPDAGAVHYDLGAAFEKEHDLNGAVSEYRQAFRLDPTDERAAYALGEALYQQGRWTDAAAAFSAALRLAPKDAEAYCALGLAQLRQDRVDDAIPELYEAVRLNPQNAVAHAGLAGALLRRGNRQAALKEFQVAVSLNPANSGYRSDFQRLWHQLYPHATRRAANP